MFKKFKPVTPGTRHLVLSTSEELTRVGDLTGGSSRKRVEPEKSLLALKKRTSGRDNFGHITCRHRGGGEKRHYRLVDFKRNKDGIPAKVATLEYDPNRSAWIALLHYADGEKRYILAPKGLQRGDKVLSGEGSPLSPGCCLNLRSIPLGISVHNLELKPNCGGKLVRSAGLSAQIIAKSTGYVSLKMPSGEIRLLHEDCRATLGIVSNPDHNLRVEGKAGRKRWQGIRPTVRGTAMNPVDHPHGGGEGRHNGYIPQTPWGQFTKGLKTRSKRKSNKWIIKDRRK
ncbi:50S ribosomal protein L2 [Candidatus Clavichlamydia salmonicola]|uniref:50S ribosomal protein L2 n=1 Tax=Candidatus Clavichlamydia salmonicola TaxID=469812 RepID=UPI001891CE3D|nr:50S ribosomal protein L2 [Candidatus Clavichlamydia salmonicola]MBF5050750.1 50S ribosomal protein L2 [Candidatus Clavichlamydia salmonicola]